jgi:hypothetical protein
MLPSSRAKRTPREGAGQLPALLLDQGQSYQAYYLPTGTNASQKKLCEGRGIGHEYRAAQHEDEDEAEDRRPCVEGDRASLRVVSEVASAGCIVGDVGGRCSVLRSVRAVDVRGYLCSGGDGRGSLLSRLRPFLPYSPKCVE